MRKLKIISSQYKNIVLILSISLLSCNQKDNNIKKFTIDDINLCVEKLQSGDTLLIPSGHYKFKRPIFISVSGKKDSIIVVKGDTSGGTILDFTDSKNRLYNKYPYTSGSVMFDNSEYIKFQNITVINNHQAGININKSSDIEISDCIIKNSFASGISAWQGTKNIKILHNTIINANDSKLCIKKFTGKEPPHEAISIAGTHYFEVAYNTVKKCKKEGIDVKETSAHGIVHHNYIIDCDRQGLYVDSWLGVLENIEFHNNVVTNCEVGFAISAENGSVTKNISFHHNLIYNNRGVGIYFSKWGKDNPRTNISIINNTIYHNGHHNPHDGFDYYWLCGGCYIYSKNLNSIKIENNIFAENYPFEIGVSGKYSENELKSKHIIISNNMIFNKYELTKPIYLREWTKDTVRISHGSEVVYSNPQFINVNSDDYRLNVKDSVLFNFGAFPLGINDNDYYWWKTLN